MALPTCLRSIAGADILSEVSQGQLARVRTLAAAVDLPLDLSAAQLGQWTEATAGYLAKMPKPGATAWRDFYEDVLALFAASSISLKELVGRKVLLSDEKKLLVATADARGDVPPVFTRSASARGRRGEGAPNPPSAIARKFRFLNQGVGIPEEVVQKFGKAGLLRNYDPVEALEALKGALESVTENQWQEALRWAFRVWRADGDEAVKAALHAADLRVPCSGGWMRARDALMSASWSALGRILEQYFDEAAAASADCRAQRNRLLVAFSNWPRARAEDRREDWTQFLRISMSRKGNCWDNAPMESCWGSLKNELVHHRRYVTRAEAMQEITEYIEIFYNRIRKQARLGYLSPAAYKQRYYALNRAA